MSIHTRVLGRRGIVALLAVAVMAGACGDGGTEPEIDEAFVGNWTVTSFIVDQVEFVVPGPGPSLNVSFGFFSDGSYQLIVGGDTSGLLCDVGVASCNEDGDFSYSGNVITLDPGTADQLVLQVSVSGDTMTMTGSLDGTPFSASFERN